MRNRVSVVSLLWRNARFAQGFLETFSDSARAADHHPSLVLVRNGPEGDDARKVVESFRHTTFPSEFPHAWILSSDENLGFAGGMNFGLVSLDADIFVLANLDLEFDINFFTACQELKTDEPAIYVPSIAQPTPKGPFEEAGPLRFGLFMNQRPAKTVAGESVVIGNGSCIIMTSSAVKTLSSAQGLFWPELHSYGEDIDLFLRARERGIRVTFEPSLRVTHFHGGSFGGRVGFGQRAASWQGLIARNHVALAAASPLSASERVRLFLGNLIRISYACAFKPNRAQLFLRAIFDGFALGRHRRTAQEASPKEHRAR
jgi:GT2 family glycosyltransferase